MPAKSECRILVDVYGFFSLPSVFIFIYSLVNHIIIVTKAVINRITLTLSNCVSSSEEELQHLVC